MAEIDRKDMLEEMNQDIPAAFETDTAVSSDGEDSDAEAAELSEALPEVPEGGDDRDYSGEVRKLLEYCPEMKGRQIPDEVVADFTMGKDLVQAYREYERRSYIKQYGENTKASREREAMRQNAQTSLKAPVRGVYGGGATDTSPSDDFLAGFNADNW